MAYDDYLDRLERNRRHARSEMPEYEWQEIMAERKAEAKLYEILPEQSGSSLCPCGRVKEHDRQLCQGCYGMDEHEGTIFSAPEEMP